MTSGAIQHGVPTKVFRTLFLVISPPVARKALTPKSKETRLGCHLKHSHNVNVYLKDKLKAKSGIKLLYQQFAQTHPPQAEYFQLLDPFA